MTFENIIHLMPRNEKKPNKDSFAEAPLIDADSIRVTRNKFAKLVSRRRMS